MTNVLNSLMSGGYEPDKDMDFATEKELQREDFLVKLTVMSLQELYAKRILADLDGDKDIADLYDAEIKFRGESIDIPPCSTLAEEPVWMDDPEHEDRRKDYLENYAADDELPF